MALVLDETFATSIPGGFATARSSGGTFTQTYNAGASAVDLAQTGSFFGLWDITSLGLTAAGEMEIDIEMVSSVAALHAFGGWLLSGSSPAVSNGISGYSSYGNGTSYLQGWTGGTAWTGLQGVLSNTPNTPFVTAGDRHTLNMRWDTASTTSVVELRYDGVLTGISTSAYGFTAFRPGVVVYGGTIRLHSIKVWDVNQAAMITFEKVGMADEVALLRMFALPNRPIAGAILPVIARFNYDTLGAGRIDGTVMQTGSPANTPLSRRVLLLDESRKDIVAETWSDAAGNYTFLNINKNKRYTAISHDYTQTYQAVAQDAMVPSAM